MHKDTKPKNRTRSEDGSILVELVLVVVLISLVLAVTSETTQFSANSAKSQITHVAISSKHRQTLDRIESELRYTSVLRDHDIAAQDPDLLPTILDRTAAADVINSIYSWPPVEADFLHETAKREGWEYWHTETGQRRYHIYATFESYDTIEYQRIQIPMNGKSWTHFLRTEEVTQSWSTQRKIFLQDGQILLRVNESEPGQNDGKTIVLGTGISGLSFFIDNANRIRVRIRVTSDGEETEFERIIIPQARLT